jgi:hypothetical protein
VWLSLVNSARRAGDFRSLYPKGVKRVEQASWYLHEAINQALMILSWFESYLSEELPPENLWDDGEAIERHFARIREKKDAEMNGDRTADDSDEDMLSNDLSSVFKR